MRPGRTAPAWFLKARDGYERAGHLRGSLAQLPDLVQARGKAQNGLQTDL